jgi:hypothetical protein
MERESSGEGPEPDFPPPRHPDPEQLPQLWNGEACQEHIIDTHTHMCTQKDLYTRHRQVCMRLHLACRG